MIANAENTVYKNKRRGDEKKETDIRRRGENGCLPARDATSGLAISPVVSIGVTGQPVDILLP